MSELQCVLASPEKMVFEGKIRSVVVPATDGEMGILPRHAPLLGALGFGELRIEGETGVKARYFVQGGGFVEVIKGKVTILATEVEAVDSIDRLEAEERVLRLRNSPPATDLEVREVHRRDLRAAERRLQLARE